MSRCSAKVVGAVAVLAISSLSWAQTSQPQTNATGMGQAQTAAAQPSVTGTIAYRERIALPPDAAIDVKIQDVSLQDSSARTVGESVFSPAGQQVPIPFQISYNQADINPAHTYQVRANISVNGKMMFTSTTAYPVITKGAPSQVAIMLQQVQAQATTGTSSSGTSAPASELNGIRWVLAELDGKPAAPGEGETVHLVMRKQGELSGSSGCNRLSGTYIAQQGALQFSLIGSTMKMCSAPVMAQEQALLEAMRATTNYQIDGKTLEILNGQQVLAKFTGSKKASFPGP